MKKIHIPNTGPPVSIDRPHARGTPTGDTGTRVFLTAHSTAHSIPAGLHVLIPNLQGFGTPEGLKSCCRARDPAVHPPEKVCRNGTGMERARDGTANMGYLIPEGLHVYSQLVGRENTTPGGVELSVPHYFYKHLIPAWSADRSLKTYADIGPGRRKSAASRPVHPPEWEWYGGKLEVGSRETEDGSRKSEVGRRNVELGTRNSEP
jgi:hypothetical protein